MTRSVSYVLHRDLAHVLPTAVRGEGPYIIDSDGKRYLDGSGGPGVSCLGHSHPGVIRALREQAEKLAYGWTGFFTNEPMEALAKLLVDVAPPGSLSRACFISSGSEAIEAALKLSRQFFIETGEPARTKFIARRASYHGNTLGALGVSGHRMRRDTYEPMLAPSRFIAPCYATPRREPTGLARLTSSKGRSSRSVPTVSPPSSPSPSWAEPLGLSFRSLIFTFSEAGCSQDHAA